jgi:hypothetical protein
VDNLKRLGNVFLNGTLWHQCHLLIDLLPFQISLNYKIKENEQGIQK